MGWNSVRDSLIKRAEANNFGAASGTFPDVYLLLGQDLSQDISEVYMKKLASRTVDNVERVAGKLFSRNSEQEHILLVGSGGQTGHTVAVKKTNNAEGIEVPARDEFGRLILFQTRTVDEVDEKLSELQETACAPLPALKNEEAFAALSENAKKVCVSKLGDPTADGKQDI